MSTALVKQLRERTGAGIMECKRALDDANGNLDKAAELLRTQGMAKAEKKVGRAARQGLIDSYIHPGGRIGSLVELNCETDFVARTPDFKALAHDIALQVAAMDVRFIHNDEVPADALAAGVEEFGDEKRFLETHGAVRISRSSKSPSAASTNWCATLSASWARTSSCAGRCALRFAPPFATLTALTRNESADA